MAVHNGANASIDNATQAGANITMPDPTAYNLETLEGMTAFTNAVQTYKRARFAAELEAEAEAKRARIEAFKKQYADTRTTLWGDVSGAFKDDADMLDDFLRTQEGEQKGARTIGKVKDSSGRHYKVVVARYDNTKGDDSDDN